MARLTVVSWRDIPSHVLVRRGRDSARAQLSPRFQQAILRAALRAGKGKSDAYIAEWQRSEPRECGDDIEAEAVAEARRLEARYTDEDLRRLMRTKGLEDAPAAAAPANPAPAGTTEESP